jgi:Fe-S oxidoreductase
MDLRDHLMAAAPELLAAAKAKGSGAGEDGAAAAPALEEDGVAAKRLVPDVIEDDVLWSCTTCGACVEQCPVDIEHVDTILDMRRYEVLMEARFPTEAGTMLRNIENRGDPWGLGQSQRLDWTEGLGFEVPVVTGHHPRRGRVPLLGRLRRRPRRAGPQDHPGHRPPPAPGRRVLRGARSQGVLHR